MAVAGATGVTVMLSFLRAARIAGLTVSDVVRPMTVWGAEAVAAVEVLMAVLVVAALLVALLLLLELLPHAAMVSAAPAMAAIWRGSVGR